MVDVLYMGVVNVSRHLKEELAWAADNGVSLLVIPVYYIVT